MLTFDSLTLLLLLSHWQVDYWSKLYNNKYLDLQDGDNLVSSSSEISQVTLLKPNNNDKTDCNFLASFYPHPHHHLLHPHRHTIPSMHTLITSSPPPPSPLSNLHQQSYHNAYLFQNKAESFIQSHASIYGTSTPFFLYYSMQLIHSPISAPDIYVSRCHASTVDDDYKADTERQYCALNVMLGIIVTMTPYQGPCHTLLYDIPCYVIYHIYSQIIILMTNYFVRFAVTLLRFLHFSSCLNRRSGCKFDLFLEQLWLQR